MEQDSAKPSVGVKRWQLTKYEGDPPKPGEQKEPFEIIEGGEDIEPRVIFRKPGADPASYSDLPYMPQG